MENIINAGSRLALEFWRSRLLPYRGVFVLALSATVVACASSGEGGAGGGGGGGGGGGPAPTVPTGYSVAAGPEPATTGANATPARTSTASSPSFFDKGALAGTSFPLLQTAMKVTIDTNALDPVGPASATNTSGATLVIDASDEIGLQVPALGNVGTPQTGHVGSIGLSLVPQTSVEADPSFAYVLPGFWLVNSNNVATFSAFVAGLQTAFSGVPSAGSALFRGYSSGILFTPTRSAVLWGQAALTVNFGTGAVNGSISNAWGRDANVTDGDSNDVALSATILSGSNMFSGTAEAGPPRTSEMSLNSSATGTVEGGFYGPNAQELGAVWTLSDGTNAAIGTIGASSAPPQTVGVPAPPSNGPNPSPAKTAAPSGPSFGGTGPSPSGETFPLISTSLDYTASGISAVPNSNATATVTTSSSITTVVDLVIPALGIDTKITLSGTLSREARNLYSGSSIATLAGLSYVSLGVWNDASGPFARLGSATVFAFGYETPASAMPSTGTAEYKGTGTVVGRVYVPSGGSIAEGYLLGNAQLTANFGTGKIDGVLNVELDQTWDVPAPWHDVSVTAAIAAGSNHFSGTTGVAATSVSGYELKSSATGVINGAFFGPGGENLGAVWTLSDGTSSAIGAIGAQRQ